MNGALLVVVLNGISIDGQVLAPDGKPAAGARLYVNSELTAPGLECARRDGNVDYRRCFCPGDEAHWPTLEARETDEQPAATADANGAFKLELLKSQYVRIEAADGSANGWFEVSVPKSGARFTLSPRPAPLKLKPVGPDGAPLPEGTVVATVIGARIVRAERKADTFILAVPDESYHQVIVLAPKLAPAFEQLNPSGDSIGGRHAAVKLRATAEPLHGVVMSAGQPVPGAKVVIDPQGCRQEVVSDEKGAFTGYGVAAPYLTTVEARLGEQGGDALASSEQPAEIELGPEVQLELDLRSGGKPLLDRSVNLQWRSTTGKTVNRFIRPDEQGHLSLRLAPGKGTLEPGGNPRLESAKIAASSGKQTLTLELAAWLSAEVQLTGDDGKPPTSAWLTADADPALQLTPLQHHALKSRSFGVDGSGGLTLWAPKPGHYPVTIRSYGYDELHLIVAVPGVTRGTLLAKHRVEGRVLDPTGAPAFHANLNAQGTNASFGVQTETDGHYALALPDAGVWTLSASSPLYAPAAPLKVTVGDGSTHVADLKLTARAPITGVVVDAAGKPVPRAQVFSLGSNGPMGMSWSMMIRMNARLPGSGPSALEDRARHGGDVLTAGPDGRFTLDPPTPVMISAATSGLQSDSVTDVTPGESPDGGLRLVLSRRDVVVGSVLDAAGKPLEAFTLGGDAVTAKDGRFRINRPGGGSAHFEAAGLVPKDLPIAAGDGGVIDVGAVKLETAVRLTGRVVDAVSGAPVKPGRVELTRGKDSFFVAVNPDGTFRTSAVPAGQPLIFNTEAPHYVACHQSAVEGLNVLKLERPASLEVRLTAKGKPSSELRVTLSPKSPTERELTMGSPRDGRVLFENLAPGDWHLKAFEREGESTLEGDVVLLPAKHAVRSFDFQ